MEKIITRIFDSKILTQDEVNFIVDGIEKETISKEQICAFIGAITTRKMPLFFKTYQGVSAIELSYFVQALRKNRIKLDSKNINGFIDVCGTGGDCLNTFNISTTVAFVLAGLGLKVAKHGNRSVSSKCGSADVLEKLGVKLDLEEENLQEVLDRTNMVFLFAPKFNSTMAKIKTIRNALKIPTMFNLLGPLINPVDLTSQIVGVYDKEKMELVIKTLFKLGIKKSAVVRSFDGLDELSTTSKNIVYEIKNNKIIKNVLNPMRYGFKRAKIEDLQTSNIDENAKILVEILEGKKDEKRDIVLLNSAFAIYTSGIVPNLKEGIKLAQKSIDESLALKTLRELQNVFK